MNKRFATSLVISGLVVGLIGASCTIAPPPIRDTEASFDGGVQNSGFLGFTNDYALITPAAAVRYNALIGIYGGRFLPPLLPDAGIAVEVPGTSYRIDREHLVKFATMNRWSKSERPPVK